MLPDQAATVLIECQHCLQPRFVPQAAVPAHYICSECRSLKESDSVVLNSAHGAPS